MLESSWPLVKVNKTKKKISPYHGGNSNQDTYIKFKVELASVLDVSMELYFIWESAEFDAWHRPLSELESSGTALRPRCIGDYI